MILLANSRRGPIIRSLGELRTLEDRNPGSGTAQANSQTVLYAADAAPGMMKMASALEDCDTEVGGEVQHDERL